MMEVDTDAIIKEVMEEKGISPQDIPEEQPFQLRRFVNNLKRKKKWSRRYFNGRAKGEFKCQEGTCDRCWSSPHSWCILDLKEQKIIMKFEQMCFKGRKKHKKANPDYKGELPTYTNEESVTRMVEWAVDLFKDEGARQAKNDYVPTNRHPWFLCAMCQLLRRPCNRGRSQAHD